MKDLCWIFFDGPKDETLCTFSRATLANVSLEMESAITLITSDFSLDPNQLGTTNLQCEQLALIDQSWYSR